MSDDKTDLQREILLTWYDHPNATKTEISDIVGCSASYVSQVTNRFDDYDQFEAMMDRRDRDIERMFGDDIFQGFGGGNRSPANDASPAEQMSVAEAWDELPNNPVGHVLRGLILIIMLFVAYKIVIALVPLL
ncbi:MAG: MarR family transcriptional regulator [Haloferacaceae archaeon]